jgi:RimJ/RimL family protein N-acetyltransferase
MYNVYLAGKQVYLRHPTAEDARGRWHEWLSDPETTKYMSQYWPNTPENQVAFLEAASAPMGSRMVLAVIDKATDKHIGVVSLSGINYAHGYADVAMLIGEKEYRSGSYAFEAFSLLLQVAFLRLNLRIVKGAYASGNAFTEGLIKGCHFREVGRHEKLLRIDGRLQDSILVQLDRADWLRRNNYPVEDS